MNSLAQTKPENKVFWQFRNSAETEGDAELILYGDISRTSWWGDEVTPQLFAADLAKVPDTSNLTVRICSGGGDVWAAQAIGGMLENRKGTVTARIEGVCASAATIIASHCKKVTAMADSTYMIHQVKVTTYEALDVKGLQDLINAINVMRETILDQYAKKTGKDKEQLAQWMDASSWWTAEQAKENGFIDEIVEGNQTSKIENRNGTLFVNSVSVCPLDQAPDFVRARAEIPKDGEGPANSTPPAGQPENEDGGNNKMEFKNVDELRKECPDLVNQLENAAYEKARKEERERLSGIDAIANVVPADMVNEAKYGEKPMTAQELTFKAAVEAQKQGQKWLNDAANDAAASGVNGVGGAAPDGVAGTGANGKNAATAAEKKAAVKKLLHPGKED